MSTVFINGILGNLEKSNAPSVRFNLTTDEETHQVNGSVQITIPTPKNVSYRGNVTGTLYSYGASDKLVAIQGRIPTYTDPFNPGLKVSFNANIILEADNKGLGGFNFSYVHLENLPVEYQKGNS